MSFLKISRRLDGFLDRLDYSKLRDPFRTSLISVVSTDCRSSKPEVTVAYLNRPSDSLEPIFLYQADRFTAGRATEALFASKEEMIIITVLSSNPIDAAFILRKVIEFIQSID